MSRRILRVSLLALPLAALLAIVAWLSLLPALLRAGYFRSAVAAEVSRLAGSAATVESADLPDAATVILRGVRLAGPAAGLESVEIPVLRVRFARVAPFGDPVEVVAEDPSIRLDPGREGSPGSGRLPDRLPTLRVHRGRAEGRIEGRAVSISGLEVLAVPSGRTLAFQVRAQVDPLGPVELEGEAEFAPAPVLRVRSARFAGVDARADLATGTPGGWTLRARAEPFQLAREASAWIEKALGVRVACRLAADVSLAAGPGRPLELKLAAVLREFRASAGELSASGDPRLRVDAFLGDAGAWTGAFELGPLTASGPGGLELHLASLRGGFVGDPGKPAGKLTLAFAGAEGTWNGWSLSGLSGDLYLEGTPRSAWGRVRIRGGSLARDGRREDLSGIELTGAGEAVEGGLRLDGLVAKLPGLGTVEGSGTYDRGGLSVRAGASGLEVAALLARARTWIALPAISATGKAGFRAELAPGGALAARVLLDDVGASFEGVSLSGLRGEIPVVLGGGRAGPGRLAWNSIAHEALALGGAEFSVRADPGTWVLESGPHRVELRVPEGRVELSGTLGRLEPLPGAALESATISASLAGKRLALRATVKGGSWTRPPLEISKVDARFEAESDAGALKLDLQVAHGEFLHGERFASLDGATLGLRAGGRTIPGGIRVDDGSLSLSDLGTIRVSGELASGKLRVAADTGELAAAALLERARSFVELDPSVSLSGTLRVAGRLEAGALEAMLTLKDVDAAAGGAALRGLSGEIPVAAWAPSSPIRRGHLAFASAELPLGIRVGARRLGLLGRSDFLALETPLGFDLWGGSLLLAELRLEDVASGKPRITGLLGADRLDLAKLGAALGLKRPFPGRLDLPGARFAATPELATFAGVAEAAAFGAKASVKGIRVARPFDGERRVLKAAFKVDGLRVKELCTSVLDEGVMDGVLDLKGDLDLHAGGRPARFRLDAASREVPGVSQELDLVALKRLARRLGTDPDSLDPLGIRTFSYDRIAFTADLDEAWKLTLRGRTWVAADGSVADVPTEELRAGKLPPEGTTEFIVRGRSPGLLGMLFGRHGQLNVVNSRPGQGVDFNRLWEELSR